MLLVKGARMPHMVIFRDIDGRPGYHQADGLEDAVRFVEHLRNEQEVSETRIFSMQEVPIEFKSYWRVEVAVAPGPDSGDQPVDEYEDPEPDEAEFADEVEEVTAAEVAPVAVGGGGSDTIVPPSNGRFGLFGRN
jgi:hypothetical protein